MQFEWQYPLFLIPHAGGYAALVDDTVTPAEQALVVTTNGELALALMHRFDILSVPRQLHNAREFKWLLESLQSPITRVVFDPQPVEDRCDAAWRVSVADLLGRYVIADNSPWNYPITVIANDEGFLCIGDDEPKEQAVNAIAVFTEQSKADAYLSETNDVGTPCHLGNVTEAKTFLSSLVPVVNAVAINPRVENGIRVTKHCFSLETLLTKYLVLPDQQSSVVTEESEL